MRPEEILKPNLSLFFFLHLFLFIIMLLMFYHLYLCCSLWWFYLSILIVHLWIFICCLFIIIGCWGRGSRFFWRWRSLFFYLKIKHLNYSHFKKPFFLLSFFVLCFGADAAFSLVLSILLVCLVAEYEEPKELFSCVDLEALSRRGRRNEPPLCPSRFTPGWPYAAGVNVPEEATYSFGFSWKNGSIPGSQNPVGG